MVFSDKWIIVTISRIILVSSLVIALLSITIFQCVKYLQAKTTMSISFSDADLELPSFTFCPKEGHDRDLTNMTTFKDYMEKALKVTDLLLSANYFVLLPGLRPYIRWVN